MEEDDIYNLERSFIGLRFNAVVYEFSNKLGKLEGKMQENTISNENLIILTSLFEQNIRIIDDILKEEK